MTRVPSIRYALIIILASATFLWSGAPIYADPPHLGGTQLTNPYLTRNGRIFVALGDIAPRLGLTMLFDGEHLLIGGTIHGTLAVDPDSHAIDIGNGIIDYEEPVFQENGQWYVPDSFLDLALGVEADLDADNGHLALYPEVVAITPCDSLLRIKSSAPLNFQTFELEDPPRRIIDIDGAYLPGPGLEIPGVDLGMDGIAALRVSQFTLGPPTVRIVLEWVSDPPPVHTLFPENKCLSVLIGNQISGISRCDGRNLLEPDYGTAEPETGIEPASTTFETPDIDDQNPIDDSQNIAVVNLPDIFMSTTTLDFPSPDDLPEDIENLPLADLGWGVTFDMNADGELTATISTPPFEELNDFTLAGNGMRLVLDLTGTVLQGRGERNIEGLGDIAQVRLGQFEENITRIVFDLQKVFAYEIEKIPDEGRIVVRLLSGDISGRIIVIDAGHGGEDPGAVVSGVYESTLNLEMAFFLKEYLEAQGANVVLTRETDVYVTLANRIAIAREANADMFVCIHNNATEEPTKIQGSLLLYNNTDYMPLYRLVHRGIAARTGVPGLGPVLDERGLYILRHAGDMPVVFVEGAFMTNSIDFARLTDQSRGYSKNIMMGVMDGVSAYYAGRDLPPVVYPNYTESIETGLFDLGGGTVTIPGSGDGDSGSAWDVPAELLSDSDEKSDESGDDDSEDDDDDENDTHRLRGRGAYRYD